MAVLGFVAWLFFLGVQNCRCTDWEEADRKCRAASNKASYSADYDEMVGGMDYFGENCIWVGDEPRAR